MRKQPAASHQPTKKQDRWFMTDAGKIVNLEAVEYITPSHINGRRWSVAITADDYRRLCARLGLKLPPESPIDDVNPPF